MALRMTPTARKDKERLREISTKNHVNIIKSLFPLALDYKLQGFRMILRERSPL
jgi:hypothetical protein